jgi:hypothetical protein
VLFSDLRISAQAVDRLREAVNVAALQLDYQVGYTLQLRPAWHVTNHQLERARLQAQKEDLENRLEYLDSTEPARPLLLRFNEAQLPALGEYIGSLSIRALDAGALRYAFQSLDADGAGMHYLLADPRLAHQERMNQLAFWERDGQPPIHFWLDPFWARHYHGRGESLIFVPDQQYLSPMMHPASANQIDAYLREIIGQWFHGKSGAPSIPARPIYLFEPNLAGPGHLTIAVLDLQQFVPLTQKLDWLNANLHLRVARLRGEEILQQIDAAMTAEEILGRIQSSAGAIQADLQCALQAGAAHVAAATGALTDMLGGELQALLGESNLTRQAITAAQSDLRLLTATRAEAENLLGDTRAAVHAANTAVATAASTTDDLRTQVEAELQRAKAAHANAQQHIADLEALVAALTDRLARQ